MKKNAYAFITGTVMYTYRKERDIYSIYACISKVLSNTAIRRLQACGTDHKDG